MADNTVLTLGTTGDSIRDIDKGGIKTPVSVIDIGAAGAEVLLSSDNPMPIAAPPSLPLPTGASTAAAQTTANASLASIDTKNPALVSGRVPVDPSGVTSPVSAASLPLPAGAATSAKQDTTNTSVASIDTKTPALVTGRVPVDGSGVTSPVSAASLPLPTGASTSAAQTTAQTTLSAISAKLPTALGQQVDAASLAVVLPADQVTALTPATSVGVTGTVDITASSLPPVPVAQRTDALFSNTTSLTPKFATVTISASGSVVALVASKQIRVLRYSVMADAACSLYFKTGASTQISGTKYIAATGGAGGSFCPVGHFQTVSGEALGLVITGSANVSVDVTYLEV